MKCSNKELGFRKPPDYVILSSFLLIVTHLFVFGATAPPQWARSSSFTRFIDHTQRRTTGLLWTSDQLVAETPTWQHTTLTTDIHAAGGIRTQNISRRAAAAAPRLRSRGHWERQLSLLGKNNLIRRIALKFDMKLMCAVQTEAKWHETRNKNDFSHKQQVNSSYQSNLGCMDDCFAQCTSPHILQFLSWQTKPNQLSLDIL